MSVYYFNGAQILAPLSIISNEPVYDVDTVSLSKQRASQGAQRWEISFNTVTTSETEADMLIGMITGIATAQTMIMPQLPSVDVANTVGSGRAITTNISAGGSSVTVNLNGVLSKGSFIKFSNHSKIYMVTATVNSGITPVLIYPSLRSSVTTSHTMLTGTGVLLNYYRDIDNSRGISFDDGILSSTGIVSLVEALI
jgi:hypothetical protein